MRQHVGQGGLKGKNLDIYAAQKSSDELRRLIPAAEWYTQSGVTATVVMDMLVIILAAFGSKAITSQANFIFIYPGIQSPDRNQQNKDNKAKLERRNTP